MANIQGSMREAPLPDVIQLVCQGGKEGCFHVVEDPKRAKIFLKGGRIIHASSKDQAGLDVLYMVALWLDGRYHFDEMPLPAETPATITQPLPRILMEFHRRMEEWRILSQKVTSLDHYPASVPATADMTAALTLREKEILGYLTGYYTINELAGHLGRPVLSLAKDIYSLLANKHVALFPRQRGEAPDLPTKAVPPTPAAPPVIQPPPVIHAVQATYQEPEVQADPVFYEEAEPTPAAPVLPVPQPLPGVVDDQPKIAKLSDLTQRVAQVAWTLLPADHHLFVAHLQSQAMTRLVQGAGKEAVREMAVNLSRGAIEVGVAPAIVKELNTQIKAIFSR